MIEFHGRSQNGILIFPKAQDELRTRWLIDCSGKFVTERLARSGPVKTSNQVKAHFGLAVEMIRKRMIELGYGIFGAAPSKDMIHEILTKCCGGVGPLGQTVRLSEQTIDQAMKFFENIKDWAAEELHLVIPKTDKNWKTKAIPGSGQ